MGHGIAHGNADEPVGDKGDVGNDADVFIAAQDALDGRPHGIAEGKGHGAQEEAAQSQQGFGIRRKDGGNVVDEDVGKEGHADGNEEGCELTEDGVLPGDSVVFGAYFIADDDGRCQADAPGNGVGQGREADSAWLAARYKVPNSAINRPTMEKRLVSQKTAMKMGMPSSN